MTLEGKDFLLIRWPGNDYVSCYFFGPEESRTKIHVVPFTGTRKVYQVRSEHKLALEEVAALELESSARLSDSFQTGSKEVFLKLIATIQENIKNKNLLKAVASRLEVVEVSVNIVQTFINTLQAYEGYTYLLHTTEFGTWLGASPELLLKWEHDKLTSVSLAGTREIGDDSPWTSKEDMEQEVVTRYVLKHMENGGAQNVQLSERSIKNAGSLAHLYTKIQGEVSEKNVALNILQKLHPTPALGGAPPKEAISILLENEGYDRQLYGGFIGLEKEASLHCFVNIRCMKILQDEVVLYAGAGINIESIPEDEWEETEQKLRVMKRIL
jgi:isochorismate synthase